jgi:hypothetical protein
MPRGNLIGRRICFDKACIHCYHIYTIAAIFRNKGLAQGGVYE